MPPREAPASRNPRTPPRAPRVNCGGWTRGPQRRPGGLPSQSRAKPTAGAMLLWLVHVGQKLLLWGVLGAVSLAGVTLVLNLLRMVVSSVQAWLHLRPIPTVPGAYPLVGHLMLLKMDSKGKGPCAQARRIPARGPVGFCPLPA